MKIGLEIEILENPGKKESRKESVPPPTSTTHKRKILESEGHEVNKPGDDYFSVFDKNPPKKEVKQPEKPDLKSALEDINRFEIFELTPTNKLQLNLTRTTLFNSYKWMLKYQKENTFNQNQVLDLLKNIKKQIKDHTKFNKLSLAITDFETIQNKNNLIAVNNALALLIDSQKKKEEKNSPVINNLRRIRLSLCEPEKELED